MADGVMLDVQSFLQIKRELDELRREAQNLRRNLSHLIARDRRDDSMPVTQTVRFQNNSNSTIPAYGVVRITGGDAEDVLTVDLVDATYRWLYLVNGPMSVAEGKTGVGSFLTNGINVPRCRRVSVSGATPAYGERWGPVSGSTALGQHRPGFLILGGYDSTKNTAIAVQLPPGEVRVKNDDGSGTLAAGGTGRTFGIYGGTGGSTDTGLEVTLNNQSSVAWATDKYGWATADAGGAIWGAPHQT